MSTKQLRQLLLIIVLLLVGIGIVAVYSASSMASEATYGDSLRFMRRHVMAVACGLFLSFLCLNMPYDRLQQSAKWILIISFALLVLVALFGQEVGGARRWFRLGRLSIQPSEFAQLALVIYLADLLARSGRYLRDFRRGLLPPIIVIGVMAGTVLVQPDLGTAIAMGIVGLLLLVIAKARWQHLAWLLIGAVVALVFLIAGADYRRRRILSFLNPWEDPQGTGYQILQSYVALASGGLFGVGVGASIQKLFYLPSAHTDFIFAIIGEELGLLGTTAILILFALFLACGFRIAMKTTDTFSRYVICGLVGMLGLEAIINMAVVTGLMPTKGLPLPFISYGGTSMVMNLIACALIFQASKNGTQHTT